MGGGGCTNYLMLMEPMSELLYTGMIFWEFHIVEKIAAIWWRNTCLLACMVHLCLPSFVTGEGSAVRVLSRLIVHLCHQEAVASGYLGGLVAFMALIRLMLVRYVIGSCSVFGKCEIFLKRFHSKVFLLYFLPGLVGMAQPRRPQLWHCPYILFCNIDLKKTVCLYKFWFSTLTFLNCFSVARCRGILMLSYH